MNYPINLLRDSSIILLCFLMISCENDLPEPMGETFIDSRDGQVYQTIEIGGIVWMAENINYFGDGVCYDNDINNCDEHGRLYTWEGAKQAVPPGWHLPTDEEWMDLEVALGMSEDETAKREKRGKDQGKKLKKGGGSGFQALLSGIQIDGVFTSKGDRISFWTATEDPTKLGFVIGRELDNSKKVGRYGYEVQNYYSVRCVKD